VIRAFRSEWRRLLRPGVLWGSGGTMVGFVVLVTIILFAVAVDKPAEALTLEEARAGAIPFAVLAAEGGLTYSFGLSAAVLGIVALVLVAQNLGQEYSLGTLKVLLSREPRRLRLLVGKLAALAVIVVAGVVAAFILGALAAAAMATVRHVDDSSWWTARALANALLLLARTAAATLVWGVMGALLAILLRASAPAVGIGIGYTIVAEGILSLAVRDAARFLPGRALSAFATWGVGAPGQPPLLDGPTAFVVVMAYALAFTSLAAVLFVRRDVST
jgi:ABC-type transport system involved in multi-copper enzyme maturation permease subunit